MNCGICKRPVVDPRQLSCSHVYCLHCIYSKVSSKHKNFACPEKDGTVVQENEIDSLPVFNLDEISQETGSNHPSDLSSCQNLNENGSQNVIAVTGIPVNMKLHEVKRILTDLFQKVGPIKMNTKNNVLSIYVQKDEKTKKLKGFALITFEDEDNVERAKTIYNGKSINQFNGAKIFVRPHQPKVKPENSSKENTPSNSVFVSGIPTNMLKYDLYRALTSLFMEIGHIKFNPETKKPSIDLLDNDTIAKITFDKEESVTKAIQTHHGKNISSLKNSKIFITKSKPKSPPPSPPINTTSASNSDSLCIVSGLPTIMSEQQLYQSLYKVFGQNDQIKMNSQTKEPFIQVNKGESAVTANITFRTEQFADEAIQKYNGQIVPIFKGNNKIFIKKSDATPKPVVVAVEPKTVINELPRDIFVWYLLQEGFDPSRIEMKSHSNIDDLKRAIFKGESHSYRAFFQNQPMSPGDLVPQKTTDKLFVTFKKISNSEPNFTSMKAKSHVLKNFHIVVDNSNIIIGCKTVPTTNNKTIFNQDVRVDIKRLVGVLQKDRLAIEMKSKIVGGSTRKGSTNTRMQDEWRSCLYRCMFTERIGSEPFVDNALHAECLELMLHHDNSERQQVLVLVTGDGNENKGQTSFRKVIETALIKNWHVELWSWRKSLHYIYTELEQRFPDQMKIKYLDSFRSDITFIQKRNPNDSEDDE